MMSFFTTIFGLIFASFTRERSHMTSAAEGFQNADKGGGV